MSTGTHQCWCLGASFGTNNLKTSLERNVSSLVTCARIVFSMLKITSGFKSFSDAVGLDIE